MQDRLTTKRSGGQGRTGVFIIQRCGRLARGVEGCNWTPDRHLLTRKITALSFLFHLLLPLSSLHHILDIFWLHFCCTKLPKGVFCCKIQMNSLNTLSIVDCVQDNYEPKIMTTKNSQILEKGTSAPTGILSEKGIYMDFPCHSGE